MSSRPDVAVVGGGYAGLMAAGRLSLGGRSVVVVDPKPCFIDRLELHRPWIGSGCASAMPMGAHAATSVLADLAGEPPPPFSYGWTAKTLDLSRPRAILQRLEPDGAPTDATFGVGPALFKATLLGLAPRLAKWEAAMGRPLYQWKPGPQRAS